MVEYAEKRIRCGAVPLHKSVFANAYRKNLTIFAVLLEKLNNKETCTKKN